MDPVLLATIHHEGVGAPTDVPRGAAGGYTYWIGTTRYERLRTVWTSYATLGYNHVSLDVALSGDRMVHAVTDRDLGLIRAACVDARRLGYVIDRPRVRAHRDSPGSSTVCPGDRTMARWDDVIVAVWKPGAPPPPQPIREDLMASFPSARKPPDKFRGADVNLATKAIRLRGGATMVPASPPNNPNPWQGVYPRPDGKAGFVIWTANDLDEYAYELP